MIVRPTRFFSAALPSGLLPSAISVAAMAAVFSGCATMVPAPSHYRPATLVSATDDLSRESLLAGAKASRVFYQRKGDAGRSYQVGPHKLGISDLAASNERLIQILEAASDRNFAAKVAAQCKAFVARDPAKFTAYYEPELRASRQPDERFRYPLYRTPDPVTLAILAGASDASGKVPYPTRAEIDGGGVLDGKGLEIVWLDDPVGRYFLHVQGSGRLRLRDGSVLRVGFAESNGLKYQSIGRHMLDAGILGPNQGSSGAIRDYLGSHPAERDAIFFVNPRYIFFRELDLDPNQGPVGALGVPLVAGRSMATDPKYVPPGVLTYIETNAPVANDGGRLLRWKSTRRFAFSHDEGGAIKGAARADLYWGTGEKAGAEAGYMNLPGNLYVVLCGKSAGSRSAAGQSIGSRFGNRFGEGSD